MISYLIILGPLASTANASVVENKIFVITAKKISKNFGGRCQIILDQLAPAVAEAKAINVKTGSNKGTRALRWIRDLYVYNSDLSKQIELDMLEYTSDLAEYLIDYYDHPEWQTWALTTLKPAFLARAKDISVRCK